MAHLTQDTPPPIRHCAGITLDDGTTKACETDISDLHHQAQRCDSCKKVHKLL